VLHHPSGLHNPHTICKHLLKYLDKKLAARLATDLNRPGLEQENILTYDVSDRSAGGVGVCGACGEVWEGAGEHQL
jgi:hypothetical protein